MTVEMIFFLAINSFYLVTIEMGEIAFFLMLIIITSAVIVKFIKNKKKARNSSV